MNYSLRGSPCRNDGFVICSSGSSLASGSLSCDDSIRKMDFYRFTISPIALKRLKTAIGNTSASTLPFNLSLFNTDFEILVSRSEF